MPDILEINHVCKRFSQNGSIVEALRDINLNVEEGNFVSIIGVSGCGKSTLLRIIGGLETDYEGSVTFDGMPVTAPSRKKGFVFQDHRLLPWLTIEDNIRFSLPEEQEDRESIIRESIRMVGLEGFESAYPKQISGGMSQRVSIARALSNDPKILLLDEPFGSLDAITKINLQDELLNIWKRESITMILVTHDIDEAIYLGNSVVVMTPRPGTIKRVENIDLGEPKKRTGPIFSRYREIIYREFFTEANSPFIYNL
ncbi:MAG: ABC transporter ATP-binding protein [Synergistaceae bacterium]|jgi:sulfonate transport system ATP-binding protein|nr:ABC transporter ATP-binding protein [Synergistaceae bacterium]